MYNRNFLNHSRNYLVIFVHTYVYRIFCPVTHNVAIYKRHPVLIIRIKFKLCYTCGEVQGFSWPRQDIYINYLEVSNSNRIMVGPYGRVRSFMTPLLVGRSMVEIGVQILEIIKTDNSRTDFL